MSNKKKQNKYTCFEEYETRYGRITSEDTPKKEEDFVDLGKKIAEKAKKHIQQMLSV